jgi:hypothetical protein
MVGRAGWLIGAAMVASLSPGQARAQTNPPCVSTGNESCTYFTISIVERIIFLPPVITVSRVDTFSTRIIGRLQGGVLFDQTYPVAFTDPLAQSGVSAAMLAITTIGGPGVVIAAPVRTQRTESLVSSVSTSTFSLNRTEQAATSETIAGSASLPTYLIGGFNQAGLGPCEAVIATLPSTTRPVCGPDTRTPLAAPANTFITNALIDNTHFVDEARAQTDTWLIFEQWEVNGTVVAIGTVHAAVQSALFDQSGRLLGRLPEQGGGAWGEIYGARVRHGDRRDTHGLAGGFGVAVTPGLTLGLGVDHGWIDIDVPGAMESGELDLTEVGASVRLHRGPFSAALSAVYGFGSAETLRTIVGSSRAAYDVRLAGAALDIGYTLEAGGWRIRPVAGLDHVRIESNGFIETDTLGLAAADHASGRTRASLGVEVSRDLGRVELAASARYVAVLDGGERTLPVAFAIAPGTPLVMTGREEGDSALVGARARFAIAPRASLTLSYDGRFGPGYDGHAGFAGVSIRW